MVAYVVADVVVTNPEIYGAYRAEVPATLEPYGGKFLVRGGAVTKVEGDWAPGRMVILEFPDMDRLKGWYHGPEYQAIIQGRLDGGVTNMIFVEGL
jgi:uncharacterized protein (DUF1330 family)